MMIETIKTAVDLSPEHLGGKGAGVFWMSKNGFNVPMAVIIPTDVCASYTKAPKGTMQKISKELPAILKQFEEAFGYMPLLSVRSGARVSMPGMMDTILNVGLDASTLPEWEARLGTACALDCKARLVEMYGSVVAGLKRELLCGRSADEAVEAYENLIGEDFPNAKAQLLGSIEAVFNSWNNERAKTYRQLNDIPEEWGTAVVIQAMVFGNMNEKSATGVLFTRNPDTGDNHVMGEYLVNAQGEDVVAGTHTPLNLIHFKGWNSQVAAELTSEVKRLEALRDDVQDVEFTVQDGKLYILQTRNAKRSPRAAVRIAVDYHNEGMSAAKVVKRVSAYQLEQAQRVILDPSFNEPAFATGIPACTGVVTGRVVLTAAAALDCKVPCILVSKETTPDDIAGMNAAKGIVTLQGGATSHAAVVARGMNKPCVVGLGLQFSPMFLEGATISIDGATGRVWMGEVPVSDGSNCAYAKAFKQLLWAVSGCTPISRTRLGGNTTLRIPELTRVPTKVALELIAAELHNTPAGDVLTVLLDTAFTAHEQSFFNMFTDKTVKHAKPLALLAELEKLPEPMRASLVVLTTQPTSLTSAKQATSLEGALMETGKTVVWCGPDSKAVSRLATLLELAGTKLVQLGRPVKGGTITEAQLIAGWLK
jgi:phosphoenolpyruvate synthase/pyruvate phosphate dikinase